MIWYFLAAGVLFALLAFWRLSWAVRLVMVLLPAYLWRMNIGGLPTTWLEVMIWLCLVAWLIKNRSRLWSRLSRALKRGGPDKPYPFGGEIVLLLFVSLLAVAVSHFSQVSIGLWRAYFLEPLLFYLIAISVLGGRRSLAVWVWPLSVSALGVSIMAWYQQFIDLTFLNPIWSGELRATSIFEYSNAVGLYVAPILMLVLGRLFALEREKQIGGRVWRFIYYLIVLLVGLGAIVFAKSDGAIIGLAAAGLLFGLLANRKTAVVTVSLVLCLSLTFYALPKYRDYLRHQITLTNLSGEIRRQQWRETWQMLGQDWHWLTGAGLAGYRRAVAPFHQPGIFFNSDNNPDFHRLTVFNADYRAAHWQPVEVYLYPHNIILNFWSELGLAGALLFVWLIGKYFVGGFKIWRYFSDREPECYLILGLIGSMTVVVIHGLVDVPYFKNDLAVLFWLLLAMMGLADLWWNKKIK